ASSRGTPATRRRRHRPRPGRTHAQKAGVPGRRKRWIRGTSRSCRPPGRAVTDQGGIRPRKPPRIPRRLSVFVEELRVDPAPGEEPPAFGRAQGDAQGLGGFGQGQAAEVPQRDQLRLLWGTEPRPKEQVFVPGYFFANSARSFSKSSRPRNGSRSLFL